MRKGKKFVKKVAKCLGIVLACVVVLFFIGRYGWRLFGYQLCRSGESLGVSEVTVNDTEVYVHGFEPGSFPNYFIGYRYHFKDDNLYIGIKYSNLIGVWLEDTGEFSIHIPRKGRKINHVYIKSGTSKRLVWPKEN
ncbi:hypothetical protein [Anaerosporobacter faecicola]|uniref:hypothetical protein n=1 Tax=Anaerosporobacter faecicola TaxID=2718714 RepID=UPI001438763D|nr:hypothetical protein [Anaerosporobacter faecicola]